MKQFCQECGTVLVQQERICRECGASIESVASDGKDVNASEKDRQLQQHQKEIVQRKSTTTISKWKSLSKKQKGLFGGIIVVLVVMIGLSIWTKETQSAEAVERKFLQAVHDKEAKKVKKYIAHSDGSKVQEVEIDAFMKLIQSEGKNIVHDLYDVLPTGKTLGIFEKYQIVMIDQYAVNDMYVDSVTVLFDDKEFPIERDNEELVVYGPFLPGIYHVQIDYKGDYADTSTEVEMMMATPYYEESSIPIHLEVTNVDFAINQYEADWMSNPKLLFQDDDIKMNSDGRLDQSGPFLLSEEESVHAVVDVPWGKLTTNHESLSSSIVDLTFSKVEQATGEDILNVLATFGEEYAQTMASGKTEHMKSLTGERRKVAQSDFYSYDGEPFYNFSGRFELVELMNDEMFFSSANDQPSVSLVSRFTFGENSKDSKDDAEFESYEYFFILDLIYNKEGNWEINNFERTHIENFEPTAKKAGSKKFYQASKPVAKENSPAAIEFSHDELEGIVNDYHSASVDAINARNFGLVEHFHTTTGKSKEESRKYIDYLESKGITEEHLSTKLESFKKLDNNTWQLTTIDEYEIIKNGDSKNSKYRTISIFKYEGGTLRMDELVSTKGI